MKKMDNYAPPVSPFAIPCAFETPSVYGLGAAAGTGTGWSAAALRAVVANRRTLCRNMSCLVWLARGVYHCGSWFCPVLSYPFQASRKELEKLQLLS